MIELSICHVGGYDIRDSITDVMHKTVKDALQKQGIKIKTSRHPGGRGAGGGGFFLLRYILPLVQLTRRVMRNRNNKSYTRNQPVFELYLRDSDMIEPGSVEGVCDIVMDKPKQLLHIGYMISQILKDEYPYYGYFLWVAFDAPKFHYNLEFILQGELTKSRVGMALRFMPKELKSYASETISVDDRPLVQRNMTYFNLNDTVVSSRTYKYFKFDRLHALPRRRRNLQYKKEDSCWIVYPRYYEVDEKG